MYSDQFSPIPPSPPSNISNNQVISGLYFSFDALSRSVNGILISAFLLNLIISKAENIMIDGGGRLVFTGQLGEKNLPMAWPPAASEFDSMHDPLYYFRRFLLTFVASWEPSTSSLTILGAPVSASSLLTAPLL